MYWLVQLQGCKLWSFVSLLHVYCTCSNYNQLSCLIYHIRCTKKAYKGLIKIFIFLVCTSIKQDKEIQIGL